MRFRGPHARILCNPLPPSNFCFWRGVRRTDKPAVPRGAYAELDGLTEHVWGETPTEYPALIYPFCAERGIEFVPVDWFLEDVFQEGIFDRFEPARRTELERELERWQEWQLGTLDVGGLPLNSDAYDAVTRGLYAWLAQVNPGVQAVVWEARHAIMLGRVRAAIRRHPGRRVLCIHGADHNYAYRHALGARSDLRVVFPLA